MVAKRRKAVRSGKAARPQAAKMPDGSSREGVLAGTDSSQKGFVPEVLDRTVIAIPLLRDFKTKPDPHDIAIDLNLDYKGGLAKAREKVISAVQPLAAKSGAPASHTVIRTLSTNKQFVFATLDAQVIRDLVRLDSDNKDRSKQAIHHIWPDFPLKPLINKSISTVKGDAAHNAFSALGTDIVWAVIDSGIDDTHRHFKKYKNLELSAPLQHRDFTSTGGSGTVDVYGHGTHVAGIIAGQLEPGEADILAAVKFRDQNGTPTSMVKELDSVMSGMAPRCKLLSLKVLDERGKGLSSSIMAALQYIQEVNGDGRRLLVHGVNLSVGYDFDPEWFACGQSPLCTEVDRLIRSGVVVVVAAGNSGYGFVQSQEGSVSAGLDLTINDPGNSDLAITVGSTHRDMPHTYGVSYFSSKGPTGDGRMKPDLLAPGEKILSCASAQMPDPPKRGKVKKKGKKPDAFYREDSGTSQAAPHVSGVIAAFLSIRREYLKQPEEVKRIFMSTATDLNRAPYFQGRGLVDAMRAIQSV